MSTKDIRRYDRSRAQRSQDETAVDAVTDIRSRRRCHYERSGLDPVSLAVHLWAETGEVPGWDDGADQVDDMDDGGGWAA